MELVALKDNCEGEIHPMGTNLGSATGYALSVE